MEQLESDLEKYAETLRTMSRHEDALINNRFTWFSTLQGLLFAALAFTWKKTNPIGCCLVGVFCLLGGLIAVSTRRTIKQADDAHDKIRAWWQVKLAAYAGPGRTGAEVDMPSSWIEDSKVSWNNVPTAFIWVWALIFGLFSLNFGINWFRAEKASSPTVVSIQAAQATIDIQQSEQPTKQAAPAASVSPDTARVQRTTNQKPPTVAGSAQAASPPK